MFREFIPDCKRSKLFDNTIVLGEDIFFTGFKLLAGLGIETTKLFLRGDLCFMGCLPEAFNQVIIGTEGRCIPKLKPADSAQDSVGSDFSRPFWDIMLILGQHQDEGTNNTRLVLGRTAGIRMMYSSNWGGLFATGIIMMIPSVLVYLTLQKYVIAGLTLGAVKG